MTDLEKYQAQRAEEISDWVQVKLNTNTHIHQKCLKRLRMYTQKWITGWH